MPSDSPLFKPCCDELVGGRRDNMVSYHIAADSAPVGPARSGTPFAPSSAAFEAVCNVRFVESSRANADIVENKLTAAQRWQFGRFDHVWTGWHD